jgi:hypothetical protein
MSESGSRTATIFYALTLILAGLLFAALWGDASYHNRLIDVQFDAHQRQRAYRTPLVTVAIFFLSIGITFLNADLARLSWILILPASLLVNKA